MKLKNTFYFKIISESQLNPGAFYEVKGAEEFIRELEYRDIKIAIATGGWKISAETKTNSLFLPDASTKPSKG